jgi:hypothetical protein
MPCLVARCLRWRPAPWRPAVLQPDAGQHAEAVGLDEDLAFLALLGADLGAEVVVGAQEPLAVPAVLGDDLLHLGDLGQIRGASASSPRWLAMAASRGRRAQTAGDEDRLGHLAFLVGGGLEALAGRVGEAVEIQAVVPVGAADQRQAVRPEPLQRVAEAALQVLVERLLGAGLVVVGHRLVEDAPVAGLLEIGGDADDEPVRIVVEAAADVVVAALGERLVLVIGAAGRQLRGGQVEDALAGARRHHVHKAQQVLVGVAEAEAAADAGLIERRRARHVEGGHALVGVPDIDHAVGVNVGRVSTWKMPSRLAQYWRSRSKAASAFAGSRYLAMTGLTRAFVDGLRVGGIELLGAGFSW